MSGPNHDFWDALSTICTEEVKKLEQEQKGGSAVHGTLQQISRWNMLGVLTISVVKVLACIAVLWKMSKVCSRQRATQFWRKCKWRSCPKSREVAATGIQLSIFTSSLSF